MIAKEEKFTRILEGGTQFRIPIYQRKYSWERKECKRLFDDIIEVGKNDEVSSHFFGSIVYLSLQHSQASVQEMMVIDGQQRLTTVMLLLCSLSEIIENKNLKNISTEEIRNSYLFNSFKKDETSKRKLVLTETDADTFRRVLDNGDTSNLVEPSKNILDNFAYFEKRIKNLENDLDLEQLWEGIRKLTYVDISLTEGIDKPQIIFESLNSTGKGLTEADKIRNLLLMGLKIEEQEKLYKEFWFPMERRITEKYDEEFDEFVQDFLTVKQTNIPTKREIYVKYKDYFAQKNNDNTSCLTELNYYSKHYATLALGKIEDMQIKESIYFLNKLRVTVAYPFLLQVFSDFEEQVILKDDVLEIMELIQSYIFRRQICGGLTSGHGEFFAKLYDRVDKDDRQKYVESVKAEFQIMEGKYRFPADDEFMTHLLIEDMYNRKPNDYPLLKMENFLRPKEKVGILNLPTVTIEHILPQNPNLSKDWQDELGDDWKGKQSLYLNRLGNLTITQLNSELSDLSFPEKKEKGFNNTPYYLSGELKHLEHWNGDEIEKRTKELVDLALKVWKHPKLSNEIMQKYKDEEEDTEDKELEPEETWETIRKLATPEAIELQDQVIKQVAEKFDCFYQPDGTALKFFTNEKAEFRDLFLVMSGRKTVCKISFRVNPSTYEDNNPTKIKKVVGWWFRHSIKTTGNERRMRVAKDDIPLVLKELEHAYKTTLDYDNYKNK